MKSLWLGLVAGLGLVGVAKAQGTGSTVRLIDTQGYYLGVTGNPLHVTVDGGGGGNTVAPTNAGTSGTQANGVQGVTGGVPVATTQAPLSGAWTDASFTATTTAGEGTGAGATALGAQAGGRIGIHIWNNSSNLVCFNYTSPAAYNSTTTNCSVPGDGSGVSAGSIPIPGKSAYLEDQPGNVSPEALSFVCAGASCPLTIKVR